jgi:hypothetical protein
MLEWGGHIAIASALLFYSRIMRELRILENMPDHKDAFSWCVPISVVCGDVSPFLSPHALLVYQRG